MASQDLLLSSDYPIDKIVKVIEGSLSVPPMSYEESIKAHGLPFAPLVMGNYSTDSSFNVAFEFDTGPVSSSGTDLFEYRPQVYSTSSSTVVSLGTFFTSGAVTIYYRLYCLKPATASSTSLAHTSAGSDKFVFNTDFNYTKLHLEGSLAVPDNLSLTPQNFTVNHGLGYRPQALIWIERDGMIMPKTQSYPLDGSIDCVVNTNNIVIQTTFTLGARVHYRIYRDE